ncbi:MAG: MAPK protein hog1 [Chaenotheca gracillima]|nr:MAG: MAPK protein hog1 [Chaenotheca gracillima]
MWAWAAGLLAGSAMSQTVKDLSGLDWTLENPLMNISVPGSVPSHAHLDLYAAQVIGDPYFGLNDFNLRWVANTNWTYSASMTNLTSENGTATWMVFNGLDTFTDITFCGQHVASTNNQFRQYYFDVSELLSACKGDAVLSINFGSAPMIANEIAAEPGQETWPYGVEIPYEFPNRQFIRKEQSDFGWDWGPAFAPAGIWQPAYAVQVGSSDGVYVRNSLVDIYRQGQLNNLPPDQTQPWVFNASIDFLGSLPKGAGLNLALTDSQNKTVTTAALSNITTSNETITGSAMIDPSLVDLWWPNGLGPQTLYNASITVVDGSNNTIGSVEKRLGFRTIVLNMGEITQEQLDQGVAPGNNWHFEVNGHEFYAKGSNFIPPDVFWPRVNQTKMENLFDAIVKGNQNMLRVWASGSYTPSFIYDIADETGVLLWSEFEFGDALYPVDQDFLDNVQAEALYNVRRVNHHPSLALWAGGNELESLELANAENADPGNDQWMHEYEQLFLDVLLPVVYGNSRSISYTPSSTNNGYLSLNFSRPNPMIERYNNATPGSIYGDTDHYEYNSTLAFNFSSYPIGRFANEFGYHSMPSLQSWQQVLMPEDLHFNSSTIVLRNHHYPSGSLNTTNYDNSTKGMGEMTYAVQQWYPSPQQSDPIANFSAWCHTTQIFQADFYISQIAYYRRGSGLPERNLGSLYWQLEDIWQAPTWAGIEYDGRWKVLHYRAKDIYQPVIIYPFYNSTTGDLEVSVVSDLWQSTSGTVEFNWYDWSGKPLQGVNSSTQHSTAPVTVGALNSTRVLQTNLTMLSDVDLTNAVLQVSVSTNGTAPNSPNNATQVYNHTSYFSPVALSKAKLQDPGLTLSYDKATTSFTVEATSAVAAWVWLDYPDGVQGWFDDNGFWLTPGEKRTVSFTVKNDWTDGSWAQDVTVGSLWNNTQTG